jgi:hypothetical protein
MRKVVSEGGVKNSSWNPWAGRTQLPNHELIVGHWDEEEDAAEGRYHKKAGVLQHPITAEDIGKFMNNEAVWQFSNDTEIASSLNVSGISNMKTLGKDGFLWEFDDHFGDSQLVYAITVNR